MKNKDLLDRFLRYIAIDTQSDPTSTSIPSTKKQLDLIDVLKDELTSLEIEYHQDKNGYLTAKLESNLDYEVASIGFLAHVDTSYDYNGANVKAQVIENYRGQDILFKSGEVFSPSKFNELNDYLNKTIITTDGTSLLGSDDKSGVAIIMEMLKYFRQNPAEKHGEIYVAFTLDEEIGTGIDNFDLTYFKPDFAYTIDGGELGELNYETFNAAALKIEFIGLSVHPGSAKNKMINALEVAFEFHSNLPVLDKPEYTEDYEGFYCLMRLEGSIEKANLEYIIRDHSTELFEYRKNEILRIIDKIIKDYPDLKLDYTLEDQYYNMKEPILAKKEALTLAENAMKKNNITPNIIPIRGGTDGAKLSFEGIPCPNLFTGGHNFHGKYEFTCLESMSLALEVVKDIIKDNIKK